MHDKIPYLDLPAQIRPLRKDIDAAIARNLDACSFCLGPDVVQFEKDFAKYAGAEHCVAFNSGTSALHVALLLLNIKQGDEIITTPHTCSSWVGVSRYKKLASRPLRRSMERSLGGNWNLF